jgi:para-nitrobenzyl esterase
MRKVARKLSSSVYPICLGLAAICALVVGSPRTVTATPVIVTTQGRLTGISTAGEDLYLGIPYAAPPVGELRWRPPHSPAHFKGVFKATQFGSPCVQPNGTGGTIGTQNCLSLNVYVPNVAQPVHGFAVMVWIHGGALVTGAGLFYDPTPLVEKGNVIVVTINYRLGVLGFFADPAIDAESHPKANYGLMDQQFALQWVRQNIGAFGGNGNRVTIFGESAGGVSVYSNLASPTAAGLFRRAISESGGYSSFQDYQQYIVPLATAETVGVPALGIPSGLAFAASVGCGGVSRRNACEGCRPRS